MSNGSQLVYNQNDPLQQAFLSALALGETGGSSFAPTEGTGGANLSGSSTDSYGFPIWSGYGNSHAAGTFQFQPSTWDKIASQFNLNFSNPSDQSAGAWYLAQQTYSANTGGQSLETALQNGQYSTIQQALAQVWPSVTGNASAPQGLSGTLGASIQTSSTPTSPSSDVVSGPGGSLSYVNPPSTTGATQGGTASPASSAGSSWNPFNWLTRGGLIFVGAIIVFVALYWMLAKQGYVPSIKELAK